MSIANSNPQGKEVDNTYHWNVSHLNYLGDWILDAEYVVIDDLGEPNKFLKGEVDIFDLMMRLEDAGYPDVYVELKSADTDDMVDAYWLYYTGD